MKKPGQLGGRDDVYLPGELPELNRWQPTDDWYHEADDIGEPDAFPTRGTFIPAVELDSDLEVFAAVTEGLDAMLVEAMETEQLELTELTVEVDTAEKAGGEETAPWRYTASIVPVDELGPPQD